MDDLASFIKEDESNLRLLRKFQMICSGERSSIKLNKSSDIYKKSNDSNTNDISNYEPIGIWQPQKKNGNIAFIRKESKDWMFWETSRKIIYKEKDKNVTARICMIGESVAAGMFFTPFFTPSIALEKMLSESNDEKYDVVDLTKNSISADDLISTVRASLQLEPEIIIIFAGNNWFSEAYFRNDSSISQRQIYSHIIENETPVNVTNKFEKLFKQKAKEILAELQKNIDNTNVKVIFALPASNYSGWDHKTPIPWLGEDGETSRWYRLYSESCQHMTDKNFESALEKGKEMLGIDGGKQPSSNRIVAISFMMLGMFEEAHKYCTKVIDYNNCFNLGTSLPGMPSFIKDIVRKECNNTNIDVVDLEKIFSSHLKNKILDNKIFIDYCHLTPEGFNLAMSSIAPKIKNHLSGGVAIEPKDWRSFLKESTIPKEGNEFKFAVSFFYIGIYTIHMNHCHYGDYNINTAKKFFRDAVSSSDDILNLMEDYIKARSCNFGNGFLLCKAGQRIIKKSNSPLDVPVARFGYGVDPEVIRTICEILDENGKKGELLFDEYLCQYVRLLDKKDGVDISEPQYIDQITSVIRLRLDSEINTRRHLSYFKAKWPKSSFYLASTCKSNIEITITCRLRDAVTNKAQNTTILVNDKLIQELTLSSKWKKIKFELPKESLIYGFNLFTVQWPNLQDNEASKLKEISRAFSTDKDIDLFPTFGEVFSIIAKNI